MSVLVVVVLVVGLFFDPPRVRGLDFGGIAEYRSLVSVLVVVVLVVGPFRGNKDVVVLTAVPFRSSES